MSAIDATPVVDVEQLRRDLDRARKLASQLGRQYADLAAAHAALIERALSAGSLADARRAAERAAPQPTPPMEMDADLRARLARDTADLHDPLEAAR